MSFQTFNELLAMITLIIIEKQNTKLRKSILAKKILAITLHYVVTGNSYSRLSLNYFKNDVRGVSNNSGNTKRSYQGKHEYFISNYN